MVKECFQFLADRIEQYQYPCARLLDVGCGNGEFLQYINERFPHLILYGLDSCPKAVKEAKKTNAIIYDQSLYSCASSQFDIVTMTGVHSEFASAKEWIPYLLRRGKKEAVYFVMGYFNPHPIDIRTTWTYRGKTEMRGFNIPSERTVLSELKKRRYHGIFEDFQMQKDIPKSQDPRRAWTFRDEEGNNLQTNGACQLLPFKLLTITATVQNLGQPRTQ